jgi:DNA-binding transcriptional LysR family regulator
MRDAAVAGIGIALLPTFLVGPELTRGALKTIEVGAATESADIFVAYPTARGALGQGARPHRGAQERVWKPALLGALRSRPVSKSRDYLMRFQTTSAAGPPAEGAVTVYVS